MDNNDKNNLDDSNDTLEENSFLNENIDDFIIRDDDKQYKTNEPLYTEISIVTQKILQQIRKEKIILHMI